jgi:hypothetical protein
MPNFFKTEDTNESQVVDYALGESGGKVDDEVDPLQSTPEVPKKRRRKFAADSDTDFMESDDTRDESSLEDANESVTSMKLADPPASSSVAPDPCGVKSAKAKPQGMYQQVQKLNTLSICIRS